MAKIKNEKQEKTVNPTFKDTLYPEIGTFLANTFREADVVYLKKIGSNPSCVLITMDGKDYCLTITAKKNPVEYEIEDVITDFTDEIFNCKNFKEVKEIEEIEINGINEKVEVNEEIEEIEINEKIEEIE